jgi:hypothetical protein
MSSDSVRTNKDIIKHVEELLQTAYKEEKGFNAALDSRTTIEVPSLKPGQGPYVFDASEVLYWTDRDAYNDELSLWDEGHTFEIHKGAIDQLRANDQVPVFHDLADAIRRNRVAPFVGAGMSSGCKYPGWGAALDDLLTKIPTANAADVKARIAAFEYLEAAQILWDADAIQFKNFIRTRFSLAQIPPGGIKGPINLLPKFSHGCVITTNFDPVIEEVLGSGVLQAYMHGTQKGNKFVPRLIKGDRCILKLHGDAEDYDTYVFTATQYNDAYGLPFDFGKPLPRALRQIFVSQSLLFLGCSLEKDRTLELFQHVLNDGQFEVPDHFAILPEPVTTADKSQKESRLLPLKIRPIWYPHGKHEFVEQYLALAIALAEERIGPF